MSGLRVIPSTTLSSEHDETPKIGAEYIRTVQLFFKSYLKKPDPDDPEIFVAAWLHVVAKYPIDLVRSVLEPGGSFRLRNRYVPDISEVAKALDREISDMQNNVWHEQHRLQREQDEAAAAAARKSREAREELE